LAMSPLLRINGAGIVDLMKNALDYGIDVSIVGSATGQGGQDLAELKGLTIPVKLKGSLNDPKISVDLASMLKGQAEEELKAKINEKLEEEIGGDLGDLLGGVLGTKKEAAPEDVPAENQAKEAEPEKAPEKQLEDALKNKLKDFF